MSRHTVPRPVPDVIRRYSVLIALFWLGLAVLTNVFVPQLETVAESHNVSLSPQAPRQVIDGDWMGLANRSNELS